MYKIKFDYPNLPKGGEIDITGLNRIFENGKEYQISNAEAEAFRLHNNRPVVSEDPLAPVTWENGPTLLEAFKDNEYVTVETVKAPQREADK